MKFFLRVRTSFGWPGDFPINDGVCRQNTSHDTFVHVQLITERSAQVHHADTRTRVAQGPTRLRIAHCGVSKKILSSQRHFSYVAALVTEHFYTISFTYLSCPLELDQEPLRDSQRSGGSTKSASPTRETIKSSNHDRSGHKLFRSTSVSRIISSTFSPLSFSHWVVVDQQRAVVTPTSPRSNHATLRLSVVAAESQFIVF